MSTTITTIPQNLTVPISYTQTALDLLNYNGTFGFLLDIRSKLLKLKALSVNQWESAKKCLVQKPKALYTAKPNEAGIQVNVDLVVTIPAARAIARERNGNKYPIVSFNPRTFKVREIRMADGKGYIVRGSYEWSSSVTSCRCCGRPLTDWRSQATGVGPVCVKGTGIRYVQSQADVQRFQQEMEDYCKKIGEFEFYVKKYHIMGSALMHFENAVDAFIATMQSHSAAAVSKSMAASQPTNKATTKPLSTFVLPIQKCVYDSNTKTLFVEQMHRSTGFNHYLGFPDIEVFNSNTGKTRVFVFDRIVKEFSLSSPKSMYLHYKSTPTSNLNDETLNLEINYLYF